MKKQVAQFVPYTDMLNLPIEIPDIVNMQTKDDVIKAIESAISKTKSVYFEHDGYLFTLSSVKPPYLFTSGVAKYSENNAPYVFIRYISVSETGAVSYISSPVYGTTQPILSENRCGTSWCYIPGEGAKWYRLSELPCSNEVSPITRDDGTYKNVSGVKSGDEVVGYDIENGENATTFNEFKKSNAGNKGIKINKE